MTDQTAATSAALLKIHAARVVASEKQPYLSTALFAMVPVATPGLGTLASDAKWRLYFDPEKVADWPVDELAGVLLHEVGHCIRGHATRFEAMGENRAYARTFNIAGDALINTDLRDDRIPLPEGAVYINTLTDQGIAATREMSAEQIYHLIREEAEKDCTCNSGAGGSQQPQNGSGADSSDAGTEGASGDGNSPQEAQNGSQSGDGSQPGNGSQAGDGSQGTPTSSTGRGDCPVHGGHGTITVEGWDCGSAADGVRRAYEAEGDKVDGGVDEDRADLIRQQVAVEITAHARNRGTVPAGYQRWAKEILDPTVDWRRELASLVRRTFAQVAGLRDYTYQRPSRRASAMAASGQGIVLPAMRQPNPPKVSIVIDTSGSMSDEMLTWALAETQGVLRALGSTGRAVRVVTCDAAATSERVTDASRITLTGGGGTDMRVGIAEAMSHRDRPDLVLVLTDGYTPWPSEPLKGATLLVGLTDAQARDQVPSWARSVLINRD